MGFPGNEPDRGSGHEETTGRQSCHGRPAAILRRASEPEQPKKEV